MKCETRGFCFWTAVVVAAGAPADELDFAHTSVRANDDVTLALRDLDGDGDQDLLLFDESGVEVRYLDEQGSFPAAGVRLDWPSDHLAWTLVDLDQDGATEIAAFVEGRHVRLWRADARGALVPEEPLLETRGYVPRGVYPMSFCRDVDQDGRTDLVLPGFGKYAIHRQLPDGGFAAPLEVALEADVDYDVGDPEELGAEIGQSVRIPWFTLRDVDGDGDADLVAELEERVLFHLAQPELAVEPSWSLDLEALARELPEDPGVDLDDLMKSAARRVDWEVVDLDGEAPNDLVLLVGSTIKVYRGAALTGPSDRPDQLLKSSGNVLFFFLRDVLGDERPELQLARSEGLSLSRVLRWLILPGELEFDLYTYGNQSRSGNDAPGDDAEVFTRRPIRRNGFSLTFPRLFSFVKRVEDLEEEFERKLAIPAKRMALEDDGLDNDVVDLIEGELQIFRDRAPSRDEDEIELEDGSDFDDIVEAFVLRDLDELEDGEGKTVDLGDIEKWSFAPGAELREACSGKTPDAVVAVRGDLDETVLHVHDLDGDGLQDLVLVGRDDEARFVVQFLVRR